MKGVGGRTYYEAFSEAKGMWRDDCCRECGMSGVLLQSWRFGGVPRPEERFHESDLSPVMLGN